MTKNTLRPSDAARILQVSRMTIYRMMESGRLMPVQVFNHPRIPRAQLEEIQLGIR